MNEDILAGAVALAFTLLVVTLVAVLAIKSLMVSASPNSVAVLTGRKQKLPSGETVGYRTVVGGRTLRVPLIEWVQYMSLETFPIQISVPNVMTEGNAPLNIQATANVKIASEPPSVLNNAVDRLLGKSEDDIMSVARDALWGAIQQFVAAVPPEKSTEGHLGSATALSEEVSKALAEQGFHLEALEIQILSQDTVFRAAE